MTMLKASILLLGASALWIAWALAIAVIVGAVCCLGGVGWCVAKMGGVR